MALKNESGMYECPFCHKEFVHPQDSDACRDNHDIVYVMMTREELNRIVNYMYNPDEELLDPDLIKRLKSYLYKKH